MSFSIIKRSLKKDIFFTLLITFQITITILFINSTIFSLGDIHRFINKFNVNFNDDTKYFALSDDLYDTNDEKKFLENPKSFDNIKQFYEELTEPGSYKFLIAIMQPLEIINFKGDNKFLYSYERFNIENDKFEIEDKKYSRVKNICVNDVTIKEFSMELSKGRFFSKDDYNFNNKNNTIPILIGKNLSEFYNIGDKFKAWMYFDDLSFEVIGVLNENTYILDRNGEIVYLDNYTITPSLDLNFTADNKIDYEAQLNTYLSKVSGIISTDKNNGIGDFINRLDKLKDKYNIFDFSILGISSSTVDLLKDTNSKNLSINITISLATLAFTTISLVCILLCKLNKNSKDYGIYLLNGATKGTIYRYVAFEVIFILGISSCLSYISNTILYKGVIPYNIISIFISSVPIITSLFIYKIIISKYSIYKIIKGDF